jgi:hypothetical protein
MKSHSLLFAATFLCTSLSLSATSFVVSGDIQRIGAFGNVQYLGAGAVGAPGDLWNLIEVISGEMSFANLVTSGGATTGITFTMRLGNLPQNDSETAPGAAKPYPEAFNGLFKEYAYNTTSTPLSFSFTQLDPTLSYTLHLFGAARVDGTDYAGSWLVNGVRKSTAPSSSADGSFLSSGALGEGLQYVTYSGLTAVQISQGVYGISGSFGADPSGVVVWNGWQLVAVPEPATVSLWAGLGAALVLARRRGRGARR